MKRRTLLGAGALLGAAASAPALADFRIEITGVGANQQPIAVKTFAGTNEAPVDIGSIVAADLGRTGAFRLIETNSDVGADGRPTPELLKEANAAGASVVVTGTIMNLANSRWDVRMLLTDTLTGEQLDSVGLSQSTSDLRFAAHRIADAVYTRMTGEGPMFASRIAYVRQRGPKQFDLVVSDCDGYNAVSILSSPEPIISPAWSPDGRRLAYVSFEKKKPIVYVQELASGMRRPVAMFPGNNSAPAWSPDGKTLAVALSKDGLTQIYFINSDGSGLRRFTRSYGIDTEPVFSRDGYVYFTSDRGGTPQIYRQKTTESRAERITFGSNYAISPDVSPDGSRIAYISRIDQKFRVAVMDLETVQDLLVTNTDRDESPSFAPNGRFLVYATEEGGRGVLGTCSADARLTMKIAEAEGSIREPAWGPVIA